MNLRKILLFTITFLILAFIGQYIYIEKYFLNSIEYEHTKKNITLIRRTNISTTSPLFFQKIDQNTKYLLMQLPAKWSGSCGGLANQLWRLAVLYSIGKSLNRAPGILNSSTWTCDKLNAPNEVPNTFPNLYSSIPLMKPDLLNSTMDDLFKDNCCKYQNVTDIYGKIEEKYLIIYPPPQSPIYLQNNKEQIKQLFQFSKNINIQIVTYINQLFQNDITSHKFCVHTRLGDFGTTKWPMHKRTDKNFTEAAIKFVITYLKVENHKILNYSIVLLGEDKSFL
ncbi:hypothetical protein Mgra_00010242 [Meloidogyne graminicola]|uniref:Uncharacterized protein n=1 Tax=Meloidogyne graminicola TaxID=189291 RepID=A0A8S9ZD04_9BILA|nr:hypothetical protein Mgra_00010242 [Meloidogyne graminicola]